MGFNISKVMSITLKSMDEIDNYISKEKEDVKYIAIENYIDNNAIFMDDEFYGRGTDWVSFNEEGFKAFCETFNIPYYFVTELVENSLVTKVLNDYISKESVRQKMRNYIFVVDNSSRKVLGVVSKTYVQYYNRTFVDDIKKHFPKIYKEFEVVDSYTYNTNFYMRVLSPKITSGVITGRGGTTVDESKVGLQLANSMVGNSSIKIDFYIYRMICANGLIIKAHTNSKRVMHSGKQETFNKRLAETMLPMIKNLKTIPKMIETLVGIQYNPKSIVDVGGAEEVYKIIPLSKNEIIKRRKLNGEKLKDFDVEKMIKYPYEYAGENSSKVFNSNFRNNQSIFDLINVFTEYAHSKDIDIKRRLEIEERTGDLVNWIIKNKNSIEKQNSMNKGFY